MDVQHAATPIFTDASGRRATVLLWVARGLCACFVLLTGAVAFTLLTRVSLPGLGGLVGPESAARPPSAADGSSADGKGAFDAARRSLSNTPMDVTGPGSRSESRTSAVSSAQTAADEPKSAAGSVRPAATAPGASTTRPASTQPTAATPPPASPPTSAPTPAPVKGANSQGTTRSGNANPSPGTPPSTDPEPNTNAASGRAVGRTDEPTTTPPGRTK